jgi:DNA-binding NarL/FixJ family response regulator
MRIRGERRAVELLAEMRARAISLKSYIITLAKMEAPTAREIEVLELVCQGCSTKEIAYRLGIAFKTAESHRSHLFEKAGVDSAVRLFRWALEEGYLTVNRKPSATQK